MTHSEIRRLFNKVLRDELGTTIDIVIEDQEYKPNPLTPYIKTTLIPVDTKGITLSGDGKKLKGIYQISIFTPRGEGTGLASGLINAIDDIFPLYSFLPGTNEQVQLMEPVAQETGKELESFFHTPLSLIYVCYKN